MVENKYIENIIEDNSMDYASYILLNRVIPDLRDSMKPVTRRILYTMYEEKATKLIKSQTISGKVMKYHPHGDTYPTMVGMVQKDNQLIPWIEGKGNFTQHTSRDLQYASSRYTEIKLSPFSFDILKSLNNHSVNFIPNYDGTATMPEVLPVEFPTILHYCQSGIGLGMASKIPSFNMNEIAAALDKYILNGEKIDLIPDFATGGEIILSDSEIEKINNTGIGLVKVRAKYTTNDNIIKITEIPHTTTREAIIDKIIELIKAGKLKEILKVNDITGLKEMAIIITCKKNVDLDRLMDKLFILTPLQDNFNANMNVICDGLPKVLGVWSILDKWIDWRKGCIVKAINYDIEQTNKKLHLYYGFNEIIQHIDRVIEIMRYSKEVDIISNLVDEFNIDNTQAEYISDMKLKNINKEYIKRKIDEIYSLENYIKGKEDIINNNNRILDIIRKEVLNISKKYGQTRRTSIVDKVEKDNSLLVENYNCRILYTKNYIKKYLKHSDNHKLKENEYIVDDVSSNNRDTIFFITNKANRYKVNVNDLDTLTNSSYGQYISNIIDLEPEEEVIKIVSIPEEPKGYIVSVFENGYIAKIDINSFLSANKKLANCYSLNSKLIDLQYIDKDCNILLISSEGKGLIVDTLKLNSKKGKSSNGVGGIKLEDNLTCIGCIIDVNKNHNITLKTTKNEDIYHMLDDISVNENKSWFEYLKGSPNRQGNFIHNCRNKNYSISNLIY